jgi:hypothetical protein
MQRICKKDENECNFGALLRMPPSMQKVFPARTNAAASAGAQSAGSYHFAQQVGPTPPLSAAKTQPKSV